MTALGPFPLQTSPRGQTLTQAPVAPAQAPALESGSLCSMKMELTLPNSGTGTARAIQFQRGTWPGYCPPSGLRGQPALSCYPQAGTWLRALLTSECSLPGPRSPLARSVREAQSDPEGPQLETATSGRSLWHPVPAVIGPSGFPGSPVRRPCPLVIEFDDRRVCSEERSTPGLRAQASQVRHAVGSPLQHSVRHVAQRPECWLRDQQSALRPVGGLK